MKKILLGTTGLLAVAMLAASPASAAEKVTLGISGSMEQWLGFSDHDYLNYHTLDQKSDSEVHFSGSTTLDNGLTVGVKVELEADQHSGGGSIDQSYLWISSEQMGTLQLGSVNAVPDANHNGMPDVGIGDGDVDDWIPRNGVADDGTGVGTDRQKIQYISPNFSGFQVAALYTPDANNSNALPTEANGDPIWGVGAIYNGDFDGVSVSADIAYASQDVSPGDVDWWNAGLKVSASGFTVGAGYRNRDGAGWEEDVYEIGGSYASGPYAVSLGWLHSEYSMTGAADSEYDVIIGSASYTMGPGVALKGSVFHADNVVTGAQDNEGWGAVGGVKISF